jgi:hypothetical protein
LASTLKLTYGLGAFAYGF